MAYKDKDRQKQAVRDAVKRHRQKGITYKQRQGITQPETVIPSVIPDELITEQPAKEYTNALGLTVKVLPNGLRQLYDPDGTLARTEEANGRPVSYNRPLMARP